MERGEYKNKLILVSREGIMDERMVQHKLWFMLKHIEKGMDYAEAEAWASIWVMTRFNNCVYDDDVMERVRVMGSGLTV